MWTFGLEKLDYFRSASQSPRIHLTYTFCTRNECPQTWKHVWSCKAWLFRTQEGRSDHQERIRDVRMTLVKALELWWLFDCKHLHCFSPGVLLHLVRGKHHSQWKMRRLLFVIILVDKLTSVSVFLSWLQLFKYYFYAYWNFTSLLTTTRQILPKSMEWWWLHFAPAGCFTKAHTQNEANCCILHWVVAAQSAVVAACTVWNFTFGFVYLTNTTARHLKFHRY